MKVKSALKHSLFGAKLFGVILPIVLILTAFFPNVIMFIVLGVTVFTFVGDVLNIVYIKRKAVKNPELLEEKINERQP
jgi:hypothetical protein